MDKVAIRSDLPEIKTVTLVVWEEEKKLLEFLRDLKFGQVTVFIENGRPARVENIKQSIKL